MCVRCCSSSCFLLIYLLAFLVSCLEVRPSSSDEVLAPVAERERFDGELLAVDGEWTLGVRPHLEAHGVQGDLQLRRGGDEQRVGRFGELVERQSHFGDFTLLELGKKEKV